jgi:hypothetical protein
MGQRGTQFKNAKERGEWAEIRFVARATEQRFRVSKPWGDSAPYDVMVEREGLTYRVQVKSTMRRARGGSYACHMPAGDRLLYVLEEIDFVAAYVIPADLWYIIPAGGSGEEKGEYLARAVESEEPVRAVSGGVAFVAAVEDLRG